MSDAPGQASGQTADLAYVAFNQDAKRNGYSLYTLLNPSEPIKVDNEWLQQAALPSADKAANKSKPDLSDVVIVERLFVSSLLLVVTQHEPRTLLVYHCKKEHTICTTKFCSTILAARLNRDRVVVVLENAIHVYNIKEMQMIHTICETPPNPTGLVDLSIGEQSILAYPGSSESGMVNIFDTQALKAGCSIQAHACRLAAVKLNDDASKLATASSKGTVIRVWNVATGQRLFEFSRGVKRCVTIFSLAWSADSQWLASSSNTETVHVFRVTDDAKSPGAGTGPSGAATSGGDGDAEPAGWLDWAVKTTSAYLPQNVNEVLAREKSAATARLPAAGPKSVVALPIVGGHQWLLVATYDGYVYCYKVMEKDAAGGDCALVKQHYVGQSGQAGKGNAAGSGGGSTPQRPPRARDGTGGGRHSNDGQADGSLGGGGGAGGTPNVADLDEFPPMTHAAD